jgi:membrane protein
LSVSNSRPALPEHAGRERAEKPGAAEPAAGGAAALPARAEAPTAQATADTNSPAASALSAGDQAVRARKDIARRIHRFIQNTRSGTLGVTGSVLLIFVAISMLTRIESTFNDIWGVTRGRSWFMRIVLYWGVLSLMPVLLVAALGLASSTQFAGARSFLGNLPLPHLPAFASQVVPLVFLCLTLAAFYMLMPNTRVHWRAALAGGLVSGVVLHLNNLISALYVSRVVSNSKIYGSLGLVPVFMIGMYFFWWILLFGAQVAYAWQNRQAYLEERQIENINQRGREFIALRLMTAIGQTFARGELPASLAEVAESLAVPSRLAQQIMQTLAAARLVVETSGPESAYLPARPLETITCHDILLAMRASQGQELATREEPARGEVYGEFHRIQEAERQAAASVSMRALVDRADERRRLEG